MLVMLLCSSFLFVVQNAVAEKDPGEEIKVFFLSELVLIVIFYSQRN